MTPTIIGGLQA